MDHDQAQLALHEGSLSAALITPAADANGWRILLVARTGEQTPYTGHSGTEKVYHDLDQATAVARDLGFAEIRVEEAF
jgi:hypothetical protein